ncbi:(d)CMP kinase [Angustibacter sp. Root456]|uniref:(d)CMP kinase n=1 Tax=Angustibacter sp. Root456 TaxID=1736539 RepID=UPI0006FDB154|nr:(d)CMP kinase [Angustibacter sp. Root456]KQX66477.1 cytidylate kinase [Angustibacter sp. Root456]
MPPSASLVVAVDGPSGSGKSSVSRRVAQRFGLAYLDTGAMYRALTWWCLERGVDLHDQAAVTATLDALPLAMGTDPSAPHVTVAGHDVGAAIRETRVSEQVSAVATNLDVRARMRDLQRALIAADARGTVAEGRDITTVVAPDADVRVLLTASEQARLERRARELHGHAEAHAVEATRDQVVRRDRDDSTVSQFVEAADGVVTIDSSSLTLEQVVDAVSALITERTGRRPQAVAP